MAGPVFHDSPSLGRRILLPLLGPVLYSSPMVFSSSRQTGGSRRSRFNPRGKTNERPISTGGSGRRRGLRAVSRGTASDNLMGDGDLVRVTLDPSSAQGEAAR